MAEETIINSTSTTDSAVNAPENTGGDQTGNAGNTTATVSTTEKPEQSAKTFTQAELDAQIKARLERERKNMPSKEDLKAFKAWQDSQKTAEQLSAEKIAAAEKEKTEALQKTSQLEAKIAAYSKGVKSDAVDDVISLALAKVSDDVDINSAIDAVIKKYPSFCNGTQSPTVTNGAPTYNKGGASLSGVEKAFLEKNPGLKIE